MAATRPSGAPYGPQDAGDGPEVGPEDAKPPQGDTALRERLVLALARTVYRDDDPPPHVLRICEPWADEIARDMQAWAAEQTQRAEQERDDFRLGASVEATERDSERHRAEQAERERDEALAALREFVSDTPCDPHPGNGFCQTHGERKPCPHAAAKRLLDRPEGSAHVRVEAASKEAVRLASAATSGVQAQEVDVDLDRPEQT